MPGGVRRHNKGRWKREEHEAFLVGLREHGEDWNAIAGYVPSRKVLQIRTHAQKYLKKIRAGIPFPEEPYGSADNGDHNDDKDVNDDDEDEDDSDEDDEGDKGSPYESRGTRPEGVAEALGSARSSASAVQSTWGYSSFGSSDYASTGGGGGGHVRGGALPPLPPIPAPLDPEMVGLAHHMGGLWAPGGAQGAGPSGVQQLDHYMRQTDPHQHHHQQRHFQQQQMQQRQQRQFPPLSEGGGMGGGGVGEFTSSFGGADVASSGNWPPLANGSRDLNEQDFRELYADAGNNSSSSHHHQFQHLYNHSNHGHGS